MLFRSFSFEASALKIVFLASPKMSEDKKTAAETKLCLDEEKNLGFLIAMSKTNTEKITKEILEGLSEDTCDSDSYDVDSGSEDSEDRPWRPSHSVYGIRESLSGTTSGDSRSSAPSCPTSPTRMSV